MKKSAIAAIVGGIILFIWQTLSNTVLDLHRSSVAYTPKQDTIINFLNEQFSEDGRYFMPTAPPNASLAEYEQLTEKSAGKPWAIVAYHKAMDYNMTMSMIRTLLTDIIVVWLLCWILMKTPKRSFSFIFFACLATGFIVFLNASYTSFIWYKDPGINALLIDALVSWGLCGLWLGKYLKKA